MTPERSEGFAPLVYLAVISRWKWLVIGLTLLAVIAGLAYLKTRTPMYQATAELLYAHPITISNPLVLGGVPQTLQEPDIDTVSAVVASSQVGGEAAQLLKGRATSGGYYVSAPVPTASTGNSPGSAAANVVAVVAESSNPQTAADAANAYAQAFVAWRRDSAQAQVRGALANVQAALKTYATPLARASAGHLQLEQAEQAIELQLQTLTSDYSINYPATPPLAAFSPRRSHILKYAVIFGLLLGMGIAFLLEQLDTHVRDERQMTGLLDIPVLGHLPPLTRRTGEGATVQILVNPSGPMAEAVRVLRGNLGFMGVDSDVHSVLLTSSIRSEGKSVIACNLAASMALLGERVVLVDADFRRPRIHTYMQVPNSVGLSSVLARQVDLWDAVISIALEAGGEGGTDAAPERLKRSRFVRVLSTGGSRRPSDVVMHYTPNQLAQPLRPDDKPILRVVPSGPLPPNPGEMAASQRLGEIIRMLADTTDLVIIDSPPLLDVSDTAAMSDSADGVLFVANMAKLRWPMLERAHDQLTKLPSRRLGLVVIVDKHGEKPSYGYQAAPSPARDHV